MNQQTFMKIHNRNNEFVAFWRFTRHCDFDNQSRTIARTVVVPTGPSLERCTIYFGNINQFI